MTRERGSRTESKNGEILLFPTADNRLDMEFKCPIGRVSFLGKFLTVRSLTRVKCPGFARGARRMGGHMSQAPVPHMSNTLNQIPVHKT